MVMLFSFFISLLAVAPLLEASSRFPRFTITGRLTCNGKPMKGNIIMVDDNFGPFDHLLSEHPVAPDGLFRLTGVPADSRLEVLLIIEHTCDETRHVTHQRHQRHQKRNVGVYSEVEISLRELLLSGWKLEKNIELDGMHTNMAFPLIPTWKAFLYAKRIIHDRLEAYI